MAATVGKQRHTAKIEDRYSTGGNARSGSGQHTAAKGGYRFFFRLLTGGL
jgi:hypothetical protein